MTELIAIKDTPREFRITLLKELGYDSDGTFVLDSHGNKLLDRYTEEPVKIDNLAIFPGSTIVLDNNALSVASFLEEFGDVV